MVYVPFTGLTRHRAADVVFPSQDLDTSVFDLVQLLSGGELQNKPNGLANAVSVFQKEMDVLVSFGRQIKISTDL